jgi:hypothetical protein
MVSAAGNERAFPPEDAALSLIAYLSKEQRADDETYLQTDRSGDQWHHGDDGDL